MQPVFSPYNQGMPVAQGGPTQGPVIIPARRRSTRILSLNAVLYVGLLIAILLYRGVGELGYTPYGLKLLITLSLCAPPIFLGWLHPILGLELLIVSIMPIKVMMAHDYITSSTYHILAMGLGFSAIRFAKKTPFDTGREVLLLFFYFSVIQALRTVAVVSAVNQLLNYLDFLLLAYYVCPRLTPVQVERMLRVFYHGITMTVVAIFLFSGVDMAERFGSAVLLNPNGVGTNAALALTIRAHLQRNRPFTISSLFHYSVLASAILLSGSRAAILLTVLVICVDMYKKNKVNIIVLILLGGAGFSFLLTSQVWSENIAAKHISKGLDGDLNMEELSYIRVLLFARGFELIQDNPVFGVGLANFQEYAQVLSPSTGKPLPSHNIVLSVLSETGPLGLFLLAAWFWAITFRKHKFTHFGLGMSLAMTTMALTHGSVFSIWFALPWGLSMLLPPEDTEKRQSRDVQAQRH